MLKAVLDTNVIASGLIAHGGSPCRALEVWRHGDFLLFTSPALLGLGEQTQKGRKRKLAAARQAGRDAHSLPGAPSLASPLRLEPSCHTSDSIANR